MDTYDKVMSVYARDIRQRAHAVASLYALAYHEEWFSMPREQWEELIASIIECWDSDRRQ